LTFIHSDRLRNMKLRTNTRVCCVSKLHFQLGLCPCSIAAA
jgi:hypothetical protein